MADHNIEINVFLRDEEVLEKLKQISAQIDKLKASKSFDIRPRVDMTGLNTFVSGLRTASSLMSTISNGFSGLASFSGSIGNAFSGMSNMFKLDFLDTSRKYLTAMATRAVAGSIGDMISRYDILNTFTPYMQIAGVDQQTADNALQRVNQSILGLPIGLDESAYRLRRYQMFLGDTDKATNFTIGLQNALTAGGASESMRNMSYQQIERLMATGDLSTFRQWQALITGFGVSSRFIADALSQIEGREITPKQLTEGLNDGTIAVEEFMKAVEMLGQDWSNVPESAIPKYITDMNSALDIYKGTIEAWQSNIHFAITRGGTNLMETINEVMQTEQGVGIVDVMHQTRDMINEIFGSGSSFIQGHPEMVQMAFDTIGKFMERAKGFNWELFATSAMTNIGKLFEMIFSAFDSLPPGSLEEFASFAMTIAGPLGSIFKAVQGGLPFMLGVFQRFKNFDFNMLIGDITHQVSVFADVVERVLNIVGDERMSQLLSIGLVWGAPLAKGFGLIARGLRDISIIAGSEGFKSGLTWLKSSFATVNELLPGVLPAVGGIGAAALYFVAAADKKERDLAQLRITAQENLSATYGDVISQVTESGTMRDTFTQQRSEWDLALREVDAQAKSATSLMDTIRDTNDKLLSSSLTAQERIRLRGELEANVDLWNNLYPDMKLESGGTLGALSADSSLFIKRAGQNYIELIEAQESLAAVSNARIGAREQFIEATAKRDILEASLPEEVAAMERAGKTLDQLEDARSRIANSNSETYRLDSAKQIEDLQKVEEQIEVAKATYGESSNRVNDLRKELKALDEEIDFSDELMEKYNIEWSDWSAKIRELSKQEFNVGGEVKQLEDLTEAQQNAITTFETLKESAIESIEEQQGLFEEMSRNKNITLNGIVSGIESQEKVYTDYEESLQSTALFLAGIVNNPEAFSMFSNFFGKIFEDGATLEAFEYIDDLEDLISSGNIEKLSAIAGTEVQVQNLQDAASTWVALIQAFNDPEIAKIFTENPELFGNLGIDPEKAQALQDALAAVAEMDFSEGAEGIEDIAGANENLASQADAVKKSTEEAEEAIENMASTASGKSGALRSLASSIAFVSATATLASAMVRSLARAIDSLHDKTVTVNARIHSATISGVETTGHFAESYASGGWAGTGPLIDGPSGTDTIRAWLSPGEFIVKRSAAKKFGPTFLKAVNGMDIDGAFDALMHNLARPSGMYMPTVSYNRDNHAQVNINNYGETGQGYSQRKAYAWASKL